jgi:DHA3 family macrolide efflux protein-like MFS transporter
LILGRPDAQREPAAWKSRFFLVWTGQSVSLLGSTVTQFMLIWWITTTTRSAVALSFAAFAGLAPLAILGPLGGLAADRWNRKRIMILTDAISAACMVVLMFLFAADMIRLWHVLTLMSVRSALQAFQEPASMASTPQLVPERWLVKASGMNEAVKGISTVAAAPLGALLLSALPFQWALLIDVATAVIAIGIVSRFRIPQPESSGDMRLWSAMKSGTNEVWHNRDLRHLFALNALLTATVMPAFALLPLLVVTEFHGTIADVAAIETFEGIGMAAGSILTIVVRLPFKPVSSVLIFFAASHLLIIAMGLTPAGWFALLIFLLTMSGLFWACGNGPVLAILQGAVPPSHHGRVLSLFSTSTGLAGPIGLALSGPISAMAGVRFVLILGGTVATLVCLAALLSQPLTTHNCAQGKSLAAL